MIKGAIESRIGNPNVSWETALKQNYGIDVNFLNNRLKVSADIFFEDRKDILIKDRLFLSLPIDKRQLAGSKYGTCQKPWI